MKRKIIALVLCLCTFCLLFSCGDKNSEKENGEIKNVILLIGDGMGPNQIIAGEMYKEEKLFMQTIEQCVKVNTNSYYGEVTDSAAAATALATGTLTANSVVGKDIDGNVLTTIVDIASAQGKRTGVVSTEELYGATPSGFSGHASTRGDKRSLMLSASSTSNVNLFAGYGFTGYEAEFYDNGYEYIEEVDDISESTSEKVIGCYEISGTAKSMSKDSTSVAFDGLISEVLEYLAKDEDGFFLMAEGAHIDHGGHNNDIMYMLEELLAFDDMVKYVVNWAEKRGDTLVMVTADHETGGLRLSGEVSYGTLLNTNSYGDYNNFAWTTTGHTATEVNLYVYGAKINFSKYSSLEEEGKIKNTDIFQIAKAYITQEFIQTA